MILVLIPRSAFDRMVAALCTTLAHSLWQGVLLAAVAGAVVVGTRRVASAFRYRLLISVMGAYALVVSATFVREYQLGGTNRTPEYAGQQVDVVPAAGFTAEGTGSAAPARWVAPDGWAAPDGLTALTARQPNFTDQVFNWLNQHHDAIVLAWFLVICMRCLQLGVGLCGTYQLRRVRVSAVEGAWDERMRELMVELGIGQAVGLLESGLARAPMVIGHLKPVILIPAGLLTALPPAELEAILVHELAHIRRRDYLVNLLQSLLEIVFFFNPAVLWVSKLIKTERENCCDDLAVARNKNKANYIRALLSCEEYQSSVPEYAMAFPGGKNTLLHRVKRMASNRNYSLNVFEKTVLAACLVGLGVFVMAFTAKAVSKKMPVNKIVPAVVRAETVMPTRTHVVRQEKPVPPGHSITARRGEIAADTSRPLPAGAGVPVIPDLGDTLVKYRVIPRKYDMKAKLNSRELLINGVKQPEETRVAVYSKFLNDSVHSVDIDYVYKSEAEATAGFSAGPYAYDGRYQDRRGKYLDQQRRYAASDREIKTDLLHEGLVSDTNHISLTLDQKEFILNGKTQSADIFQRYKSRYIPPDADSSWRWGLSTQRNPPNN